ncbi:alanine aminotransferase 2-like [Centroberyx affinis]|uniref:alanine aminotransferase 2-like n=1 Tax=Centroberyx affinis TaxID=166261 RepID=UPI003A5BBD26
MSSLRDISPYVRSIRHSELAAVTTQACQIEEELRQGVRKPYKEVIDVSWGDSHRTGVKPLSFVRQVLATCLYPQLANSDKLPADARQRAQRLLGVCAGGSVGSYTATGGISQIKQSLSKFISRRDGGVPSFPENIFIASGSQRSIATVLTLLMNSAGSPPSGVLTPVPSYPSGNNALLGLGGAVMPYYLKEEQGWELQRDELRRALQAAKRVCNPVALYVINPGNPTGHVQNRKSIEEVIQFVSEEKLFLLADEVYQGIVFGEGSEFISYKRVLAEMGPPFSDTVELASFHSASKGFMGECGLRGGYVELVNLDPAIIEYISTLFSLDNSTVTGQIALDLMANPPQPGDPSYPLYNEERQSMWAMLVHNVKRTLEVLNSLPGLRCQPVKGGSYVFPRLFLPPGAIQKAKEVGMQPDHFYCSRLVEEAGLCVGPGCEHGLEEGNHHFRFCIMTSVDTMEEFLRRLTSFHIQFMKDFS